MKQLYYVRYRQTDVVATCTSMESAEMIAEALNEPWADEDKPYVFGQFDIDDAIQYVGDILDYLTGKSEY